MKKSKFKIFVNIAIIICIVLYLIIGIFAALGVNLASKKIYNVTDKFIDEYLIGEPIEEDVEIGNQLIEAPIEIVIDTLEDTEYLYRKELDELNDSETDLEQWYKEYKDMISSYEDKPETIYDVFSNEEIDLLFRVVQAEIGDQYSFEQKSHVASVIFNRVDHEQFGNSLKEVLIPSQFSTISNGSYKRVEVSEKTILACEFAYEIMDTTNGCLFFDSNSALHYSFVFNDGAHNFYKLHEERE